MRGRCLLLAKAPLHDVIDDLADGLDALGWRVDRRTWTRPPVPQAAAWRWVEAGLAHPNRLIRAAARATRRGHRELAGASSASDWCDEIARLLGADDRAVVLTFLDGLPVGLARLATRARPRAVLVSLIALTQERRRRRSLPMLRAAARLIAGRPLHDDLLRTIVPGAMPVTVFPTESWRDAAVAAGVPAGTARVITLGVPVPQGRSWAPTALPSPARLLWVGRLSPEKGLHHFLNAMPAVASRRAVRLTIIAAPGPAGYERIVADTLASRGLASIVERHAAVPRGEMITAFSEHDLLLFHSIFGEPVAQVLLHAAAAGLPVVGPASLRMRSLLRDGQTAWCYAKTSPESVSDAIIRALADDDERQVRAQALYDEVRAGHNLARTVEQFDKLLRETLDRSEEQRVIRERLSASDSGRRLVRH